MRKILLLVFLLGAALPAAGQSNYAAVTGTVTDPQHLPVAAATVEFKSLSTGALRRVVTNATGIFEASALLPDDYDVTTSAAGFTTTTQPLHLEVGQNITLAVSLALNNQAQNVHVTAQMDVLRTTDASVGEVVEPKSIQELPLNGRMLLDLALTVPGTHMGFGAQQGNVNPLYWRPGQNSALVIGGGRPNANYYLLDGATNTDPTFNTQNLSLSPDAVKEFQVETSSYTADMGGAGGGQINIATRAGTNRFHGTVYEFIRNGAADATAFDSMGNNHLVQNNFGGSLGGPLTGKKTFFFVNYEGLRLSETDTQILTVPTAAEMNGDFSMSGANIYNPTANPNASPSSPRPQFAGNMIPAHCTNPNPTLSNCTVNPNSPINPAAWAFLQLYEPQPNMMMSGSGPDSNNYLDARNETHFTDQGTVRIDHIFPNGDLLFGRYSLGSENGFTPTSSMMNTTAQNLPGFGTNFDNLSQQAVVSWNHIFSSTRST